MTKTALEVVSPNTGRAFDRWIPSSDSEVESALATADRAGSRLGSPEERRRILDACEAALLSRRERLAGLAVREVGKKPAEALAEVEYAAGFFRAAREALDRIEFETRPGGGRRIREVPYGAALLIAPFNDPLAGLARKIAPALAAGAPAVVKPSRLGILSALAFVDALGDAGVGETVRAVAPESGETVSGLVSDRRIRAVSFTGSTAVGRKIALLAAAEGKRAVLELGGNCPFVILEDAALEPALDDLLDRKLRAAGQACSSVNRVFVAAPRHAEFRAALTDRVRRLAVGPSDAPGVDLGPVRTRGAAIALRDLVAEAERGGERLLNGLPPVPPPKSPITVPLSVVEADGASVFDERESFGPALSVRPFSSLDELLVRLEGERQALAIYFRTGDPDGLLPRLGRLRFGSVGINTVGIQDPAVPTGGFLGAGLGREGGVWGVREFLAPVNIRVADASPGGGRRSGSREKRGSAS